jgi:anti-anti-sigma regulatory factor
MDLHLDLDAVPACIRLEGPLTIAAAATVRTALLGLLETLPPGPVQLDLSGVSEADGTGVQLLLSTTATLRRAGHAPTLTACPEAVIAVAAALGAADRHRAFGAARADLTTEVL